MLVHLIKIWAVQSCRFVLPRINLDLGSATNHSFFLFFFLRKTRRNKPLIVVNFLWTYCFAYGFISSALELFYFRTRFMTLHKLIKYILLLHIFFFSARIVGFQMEVWMILVYHPTPIVSESYIYIYSYIWAISHINQSRNKSHVKLCEYGNNSVITPNEQISCLRFMHWKIWTIVIWIIGSCEPIISLE